MTATGRQHWCSRGGHRYKCYDPGCDEPYEKDCYKDHTVVPSPSKDEALPAIPDIQVIDLPDSAAQIAGTNLVLCSVEQWNANAELRRKAEMKLEQMEKGEFDSCVADKSAYITLLKWLLNRGL